MNDKEYIYVLDYSDCTICEIIRDVDDKREIEDVLKEHGLKVSDKPLKIDGGFIVYPWEYFCPMEYLSSKIEISDNTRTIHHYTATWMSFSDKLKMKKGYIGNKIKSLLKKI